MDFFLECKAPESQSTQPDSHEEEASGPPSCVFASGEAHVQIFQGYFEGCSLDVHAGARCFRLAKAFCCPF